MTTHLVFIYGSLRRGCTRSMSTRFPNSNFVSAAQVNGSLFDLGDYPGLRCNEADPPVIGEVYEVDDELLNELDEFEASSDYLRKQVKVSLGDQTKLSWVYEPDTEVYSLTKLIASGDWLEYLNARDD